MISDMAITRIITGGARHTALCLVWTGCLLIANMGSALAEIADSGTLNFSGTIKSGTCLLTLPPPPFYLGSVDPTSIVGVNWATSGDKPFDVELSGCTGVGGDALTPAVQISGQLLPNGGSVSGNTNLFKSSGTSKGFGVLIFSTDGAEKMLAQGDYVSIPKFEKGKTLPTGIIKIPLKATVSAGPTSWQAGGANLKGGDLTATLTFTFAYH